MDSPGATKCVIAVPPASSLLQVKEAPAPASSLLQVKGAFTFALDHCYLRGTQTVEYTCQGGVFTEKMYNHDCSGNSTRQQSGASPYHERPPRRTLDWTCQTGGGCADAMDSPGATKCVIAVPPASSLLQVKEAPAPASSLLQVKGAFTFALDHCYLRGTQTVEYTCQGGV